MCKQHRAPPWSRHSDLALYGPQWLSYRPVPPNRRLANILVRKNAAEQARPRSAAPSPGVTVLLRPEASTQDGAAAPAKEPAVPPPAEGVPANDAPALAENEEVAAQPVAAASSDCALSEPVTEALRNLTLSPLTHEGGGDAPRLASLVAPALAHATVSHGGCQMRGLKTTRPLEAGEPIGIYDGESFTATGWKARRGARAEAYALETSEFDVGTTRVRLVVVPRLRLDGMVDVERHPLALLNEPSPGATSNVVVHQVEVPRSEMQAGCPEDERVPLVALCAFAARSVSAGEELTLHYGNRYRREYAVGNAATAHFDGGLLRLFPGGVPRAALIELPPDVPDSSSDSSDEDWLPNARRGRARRGRFPLSMPRTRARCASGRA